MTCQRVWIWRCGAHQPANARGRALSQGPATPETALCQAAPVELRLWLCLQMLWRAPAVRSPGVGLLVMQLALVCTKAVRNCVLRVFANAALHATPRMPVPRLGDHDELRNVPLIQLIGVFLVCPFVSSCSSFVFLIQLEHVFVMVVIANIGTIRLAVILSRCCGSRLVREVALLGREDPLLMVSLHSDVLAVLGQLNYRRVLESLHNEPRVWCQHSHAVEVGHHAERNVAIVVHLGSQKHVLEKILHAEVVVNLRPDAIHDLRAA
mmetsp:Transcript_352/g.1078  ORF Transcript_352/g.1078 Transcript_352/m.1078 type:complete len:266 (-) Transcript_352:1544-2341(-)